MDTSVNNTPTMEIMNAQEVAVFLHISRAGAYYLLNSKGFPTLHIGERKMVTKENLLRWIEQNTNKAFG